MSPQLQREAASQSQPELDAQKVLHTFGLLPKVLTKLHEETSAEAIHAARRAVRKVEAILKASDPDGAEAKLLRSVSRVRKWSGRVRDVDVMASIAASLAADSFSAEAMSCQSRLVRHLERERKRQVRKLDRSLERHERRIRSGMKRYSRAIQSVSRLSGRSTAKPSPFDQWNAAVATRTAQLERELADCSDQRLSEDKEQLHRCRRKIRELRFLLRLDRRLDLDQELDAQFADCLGKAKDAIGLWHDWALLEQFAFRELGPECELLSLIATSEKMRLKLAVQSVALLRRGFPAAPR